MSKVFLVFSPALIATAMADSLYTAPQQNNDLGSAMSTVASQLAGQSGKSARATFISNSISKITTEFFPLLTNYDPTRPSTGGWYDVSDIPAFCTANFKNAEGKCIQRDRPQTASVQFDGKTFTAVVFAYGHFNKCGKAGGSDNWGFTFAGPSAPPSATDTTCTSDPSSTTPISCTAVNRCYIKWPCQSYCTCNDSESACS